MSVFISPGDFIMGNKDFIDEGEYEKYQTIGVTHLFALSGMHISVIVLFLNNLLMNFKYSIISLIESVKYEI